VCIKWAGLPQRLKAVVFVPQECTAEAVLHPRRLSDGSNEMRKIMKTKVMVVVSMLVFALAMMAQTAAPTAPAAAGDAAKACACCNQADAKTGEKMDCCGKDGNGCKDGKCDMKAHKGGKMACCSGADKCPMMAQKDGKAGCCGDKCPMMKGGKSSAGRSGAGKAGGCCAAVASESCCHKGAGCCKGGYMPCCSGANKAA